MKIAIIGGGIGGLTLSIALRQRGIDATVYEQASALTEIGAAVALSANATREFERLGLLEAIRVVSAEPSELIYRHWQDGRRVAAQPVRQGGYYLEHCGAPYFGIHRADLQRILSRAVDGERLKLGHKLKAIEDTGHKLRLVFTNGCVEEPDLVVGADGVRSIVRHWVTGTTDARYSGTSAFRGIVPVDRLASLPDPQAIQFWMGPGAHLLHYAIGGSGEDVNFFAVSEGPAQWPTPESWTIETKPGEAVAAFAGWHPAVTEMIAASTFNARWGLFVVPPLQRWHRGPVVLIGDSAHAMLPHHGQGANTTIEDAITLAELLVGPMAADLEAMLARYVALRRLRTRTIQHSAWATNAVLHLPDGIEAEGRNIRLSNIAADLGWIHDFDALATARAA